MTAKMRHCWNCGADMGVLSRAEWSPGDTCGETECLRAEQEAHRMEYEEAHREVDDRFGY